MRSFIICSSAGWSSCIGKQRISTENGSYFCCLASKASQRFMVSILDIKQSKPLCNVVGFTSSNLNAEHPYFALAQVEVEDSCETSASTVSLVWRSRRTKHSFIQNLTNFNCGETVTMESIQHRTYNSTINRVLVITLRWTRPVLEPTGRLWRLPIGCKWQTKPTNLVPLHLLN